VTSDPPPADTRTLAAIDIGTNSFHLVVARVGEGNRFEVVAREKEMVRLGSGSGDMKELAPDAIERGIDCLRRFRKIADISEAEVYAVATSAVREAENAGEFIDRARDEAGIEVEVISGVEEARLIHLGVLQAVPVFDSRLVLVDIGGGSTEILVGERGEILAVGSVKLGALRLTRRFFRSNRLHPGAVDACRRFVRAALVTIAREVSKHGFEVAVGSSGTIEAVAAMVQVARDDGSVPRTLNNFSFTRSEVRAVVKRLVDADTLDKRRRLPGIDEARADIMLAGAVILEETMQALGIKRMVLSENALREGALLDALSRRREGAFHHLQDLRRRSVVHLMELMDDDPAHSEHVAALALELFDETAQWHQLPERSRELLEAAALLANVGLFVSHSGHHKHSYYVIRNSDHLTGFTDHEIELIALVARYHRKSAPKPKHPEFAALRPKDQELVRALASILRVAIALDRTHAQLVEDVSARPEAGHVVVEAQGRDGVDLSLEIYTAGERKGLLEEVLGRPVRVEATTGG
jgi:exopolyphosphatase / guanosine-5'-triphosphate,3'-diphosphate pyrophosphatase